ncbi:MAG: L-2-hydroxyglutarate oxidase [Melioribacteraceae bacterium]|nr:L-2-hydroxyglutarate oxidase [Melioribacteraceae bacterium]
MTDITIIGAGIVGLSTAFQLLKAQPKLSIRIIEKESDVSKHQTGNNSGVIHSGIYYKPGSHKAVNCRKGYQMLLDFCDQNEIKYDICGKVIVAVDESEIDSLNNIYQRGIENGLQNLQILEASELKEIEPHVRGVKGIRVPQTGIIDYKVVSQKLKENLERLGVEFKFSEKVIEIQSVGDILVKTETAEYLSKALITCAGLQSDKIAQMTEPNIQFKIIPFRGEYYKLTDVSKHYVNNLIYPVPDPNFPFLGVHFTRMIDGAVEAGPNAVFALKREGYKKTDFNLADVFESFAWPGFRSVIKKYWRTGLGEFHRSFNKTAFVNALQRLIPEIQKGDLIPGGAGIRAQACDKYGGLLDDFYFVESKNIIHVCNAPSPAATSSLSIGETLAGKALKNFHLN